MNNTNYEKTRLEKKFAFWYRIFDDSLLGTKQINKNEYENQVKKIAEFDNVLLCLCRLKTFGGFFSISENLILVNLE